MKSTIRVDLDFDKNEPFIQINLASNDTHHMLDVDTKLDLSDKALKNFVEEASNRGLQLVYGEANNPNRSPQIRLKGDLKKRDGFGIVNNSIAFIDFLKKNGIEHSLEGHSTWIEDKNISQFDLGVEWGKYMQQNGK